MASRSGLPSGREFAVASLLFLGLSVAIYGWYAFHGGFIADDWVNAARYEFHPKPGFWGAVDNYQTPSRPVAAVYVTLTYALLGNHLHWHLVLTVLLTAFLSIAFFTLLRTIGVERALAFAAAALLLVFPSSDSTRFWVTGSQISLFIGMYLVGLIIAIVGRRRFGAAPTAPAVATQLLASGITVAAVAGYEIIAPAVLLSVFVYRWVGKGGAIWRWLTLAIPTVLVLVFYTRKFSGGPEGLSALPGNFRDVVNGAISIFGYTLVPVRSEPRWLLVGAVVLIILAIVAVWRYASPSPSRDSITRWLRPIVLSISAAAVGYAMIIPAAERYPIWAPGVQNRTNCLAALGLSAMVTFLAAAVASLVVAAIPSLSERSRSDLRKVLTGWLLVAVFAVWVVRINEDRHRWENAAEIQQTIMAGTKELVPSPPPDATIFTSPYPGYSSPSLPIFGGGGNNDEVSAFQVEYSSPEMNAFPLLEGVGIECNPRTMSTPDAGNSVTEYGRAILVDLRTRNVYRPRSQAQCLANTKAMEPFGPVNLEEGW